MPRVCVAGDEARSGLGIATAEHGLNKEDHGRETCWGLQM